MRRPSATILSALAVALAGVSLLLNLYLFIQLRRAEQAIAPFRPMVEEMISEDGTVRSEVRIPAGTPINLSVPIDERVSIRIDTILPIRTRVTVPIRSPIGDYDIPVPIRANVPLRATIPLRLQHTFEVRTNTSAEIIIPIELGR